MARHKEYENDLMSKTIPLDLHYCGYEGLANAIVYQCLLDIVKGTQAKMEANRVDYKYDQDFHTAMKFMCSSNNVLYRLDIPGKELAEKFIRRAEKDWRRKHGVQQIHRRDGDGRITDADGQD